MGEVVRAIALAGLEPCSPTFLARVGLEPKPPAWPRPLTRLVLLPTMLPMALPVPDPGVVEEAKGLMPKGTWGVGDTWCTLGNDAWSGRLKGEAVKEVSSEELSAS
jgi:hypothetical protein